MAMPERMVAKSWLLLIGLAAAAIAGVLQARAQPDSIGTLDIPSIVSQRFLFLFF
jgi:uncharacterized membrane protein YeiH